MSGEASKRACKLTSQNPCIMCCRISGYCAKETRSTRLVDELMIRDVDDSVSKTKVQGTAESSLTAIDCIQTSCADLLNTSKIGEHSSDKV